MADDTEAASDAWKRLDLGATSRTHRDRHDVRASRGSGSPVRCKIERRTRRTSQADWCDRLDNQLLYHAKLLRRVRIDRAAIRVAEVAVRAPEESKELLLGPKKIKWLKDFAAEYRSTEPDLVAALERVALRRAFAQNFSDLFDDGHQGFHGPTTRPAEFAALCSSTTCGLRTIEDPTGVSNGISRRTFRRTKKLSEPLRNAIASQIHLNEARIDDPSSRRTE